VTPFSPLHLRVCDACLLVQLSPARGGQPHRDYVPQISNRADALERARSYTDRAIEEQRLTPEHLVVEVGSNDGYLLQFFAARGVQVLGIDASPAVARIALSRGISTRVLPFTEATAAALGEEGIQADLLIGNNVLERVHNVNDFVAGLKRLLAPRGLLTMEFPHLLQLVEQNRIDAIRHERLSYFSLLAVTRLLAANGLTIYDVDDVDAYGGSLRIFVCHSEDPLRPITPRVDALRARERHAGVDTLSYYAEFAARVRKAKRELLAFLIEARHKDKHVAGYGAFRGGTTLLTYCGIRTDLVDYVVDPDPGKQGRHLPGTHIPIRHPELLQETRPDYVLILPSHQEGEVIAQLESVRSWGGRCVIPIPEVHMVA
jgi:SAM-dependent methyltransferase